jgi:antitoxin (DNA-binding transcriptional repressor) of toxin-antitoxin stability system
MTVSLEQAQRELAKLIHQLKAGEEMVITEGGQSVARIISVVPTPESGKRDRVPGSAKGEILWIAPDFDEPLDEFREYMK